MSGSAPALFSSKRSQLGALIALWALSSFLCSRFLITSGSLYLDHQMLYSYSYDNLHSLNWFGSVAWWLPHNQGGIPGYVYSQLGVVNAGTPLSAMLAGVFWLLGVIGIHVTSLHAIYVLHHFWILPGLLLVAVWLCARQIFSHGLSIVFALVLTAFSPAILQNVKDPGFLEITAYGLYFTAAWFHLLRAPTRRSAFWALVLATCGVTVSIGFAFVVWNVFFLPLIVAAPLVIYPPARRAARRAVAAVHPRRWVLAAVLVVTCAVPKLLVFHQRGDFVRANVEQQGYRFEQFRPGNPWQILLAGVPAVGFGNTSVAQYPAGFIVMPTPLFFHSSYLGVLALPLAIFGLAFGRTSRRVTILAVVAISYLVILLSANSPLLAPILMLESPLRSVNHYFDICYGFGGSIVLVFAAGFGLDSFLANPRRRSWLLRLYATTLAASIAIFCALFRDSVVILGSLFGFYVVAAGIIAIALAWIMQARSAAAMRQALLALLCVAVVDVATVAWHYLKANLATLPAAALDTPRADNIGLASAGANLGADSTFESKSLRDLVKVKQLDLEHLPAFAFFSRAHVQSRLSQADVDQVASPGPSSSLALAGPAARNPTIAGFRFAGAAAKPPDGRVDSSRVTYDTLELTTETVANALLFLRNPYSPYWHASIDGEPMPLLRALGHFSALQVPAGRHAIRLEFSPPGIGVSLLLAWTIIAGLAGVSLGAARRERAAR